MRLRNDSSRYGAVSQALHWVTVALVIILLVMGKVGDIDPKESGSAMFMWHSSLGVLVLLFAAARIVWLFVSSPPSLPRSMTRISRLLAHSMHLALYALLIALPLSGWLASSAVGASVNVFGIVSLPMGEVRISKQTVTAPGGDSADATEARKSSKELFEEVHEVLGNVLLVLASLHALAAFKHQLVNRDGLLSRILPRAG